MKKTLLYQTDSNKTVKLILEESLQVRDSFELKALFISLLANHRHIEIEFRNIERIDITTLQLLMALSTQAAEEGRIIDCNFEKTDFLDSFLLNSGFSPVLNQPSL